MSEKKIVFCGRREEESVDKIVTVIPPRIISIREPENVIPG